MKRADIICTMSQLEPATEKEKLELLEWKDILNELDNTLNNNERRHAEHRDYTDVSKVCGAYDKSELIPTECLLRLSESDEDWIDYIYSKRYEDLHELVSDETLSKAIKSLTDLQKEALYMIVIRGHSTKEVAEMKGCNDRNIRKHRERAITSILKKFQAYSEE